MGWVLAIVLLGCVALTLKGASVASLVLAVLITGGILFIAFLLSIWERKGSSVALWIMIGIAILAGLAALFGAGMFIIGFLNPADESAASKVCELCGGYGRYGNAMQKVCWGCDGLGYTRHTEYEYANFMSLGGLIAIFGTISCFGTLMIFGKSDKSS